MIEANQLIQQHVELRIDKPVRYASTAEAIAERRIMARTIVEE